LNHGARYLVDVSFVHERVVLAELLFKIVKSAIGGRSCLEITNSNPTARAPSCMLTSQCAQWGDEVHTLLRFRSFIRCCDPNLRRLGD
jgi:hypothetical protein